MQSGQPFYVGNAALDQVAGSGWFVGQFVSPELGLRHQTDVELKWGIHPDGETRSHAAAHGHGTTISVLVVGAIKITFHVGDEAHAVTLREPGEYVVFRPDVVHSWEAIGQTIVLTVRFPSVEVRRPRS